MQEGTVKVEVVSISSPSYYPADPSVYPRSRVPVEFVTADRFDRWSTRNIEGPLIETAESAGLRLWKLKHPYNESRNRFNPPFGPLSPHYATTSRDGHATVYVPPGDYRACVHFLDTTGTPFWAVAGCHPITVESATVVYVYLADGTAHIDTGHGAASDAYRRLSCQQQRQLGQTSDQAPTHGPHRHRCPSR